MWARKVSAWVGADPFYFDRIHRHRTAPHHADTVFATRFLLVVSYLYIDITA